MSKTKSSVKAFREAWDKNYSHISLELDDDEIMGFIMKSDTLPQAMDHCADYILANGLGDVQE